MKLLIDLQVDNGDDIILTDDLDIEIEPLNSLMRVAERRVSARYDDFLYSACGAGLERFIQKRINTNTKSEIENAIRQALYSDALLLPGEYDVHVIDVGSNKLQIIISLKLPGLESPSDISTFRIMVNLENQRSYK